MKMVDGNKHVYTTAPASMLDTISDLRKVSQDSKMPFNIQLHAKECFFRVMDSNGHTVDRRTVPGFSAMVCAAAAKASNAYETQEGRDGAFPG